MRIDEAYEGLCGEIVGLAVKDYRTALILGDREKQERLERFFRGEWFVYLVDDRVDGEYVIERVREQCKMSRRS